MQTRIPNDIDKIPTNGKLIHFKKLIVHRTPMSTIQWLCLTIPFLFFFLLLFSIRLIKSATKRTRHLLWDQHLTMRLK